MNGYRKSLRTVGTVLIIVGVLDLGWMAYCIATLRSYSSSLNIFAVIAGVLLRRGSLKTAVVVRFFSSFLVSGFVGALLGIVLMAPLDLVLTYLKLYPLAGLGWTVFVTCVLLLLAWVYRQLTAPIVLAAVDEQRPYHKRWWRKPQAGFLAGAVLVVLVITGSLAFHFLARGKTAERAKMEAKNQVGSGYKFFVRSLRWQWLSGETTVRATVVAYNPRKIETVEVTWSE